MSSSPVCRAGGDCPGRVRRVHGVDSGRAGEGRGKAVGVAAAAGMLAMRTGDHFDDVVPYVQAPTGPGVFEPIAPTPPVDVGLAARAAVHVRLANPTIALAAREELKSRRYARDVAELQAYGRDDSAVRTPAQTETVRFHTEQTFVQSNRTVRDLAIARGLDLRESARLLGYVNVADSGHDDRLLGGEVPLQLVASEPRDPAGRHGREPGHLAGSDLVAVHRRQPPGVPVGPLLLHRRRDRVAEQLLRDEEGADRGLQHRRRCRPAADVRQHRRARRKTSKTPASGAASTTARR